MLPLTQPSESRSAEASARVAASGRRKRGGARVVYLFGGDLPVFLLTAFSKNEKADLIDGTPTLIAVGKRIAARYGS